MKNLTLFFMLIGILTVTQAGAQNYLLHDIPTQYTDVHLRFMHAAAGNNRETTSLSGIYELKVNIPISASTNIFIGLPYIRREYENTYVTYYVMGSEYFIGPYDNEVRSGAANLFAGARFYTQPDNGRQTISTIGISLPTTSEDAYGASRVGFQADYHNFHKYMRRTTTVYGNVMSYWKKTNGAHIELEFGPRILFLDSDEDSDPEFLLHYGIGGSVPIGVVDLRMELAGLFFLSASADEFSDKFDHTLAFGARYNRGPFTPGVFYLVYLSDRMNDTVNGVLGVDLIYRFGQE